MVLVPIRSFADAKSRLAVVLTIEERRELARSMAVAVVSAAHELPVRVVTDDNEVVAWAESMGITPLRPGVSGLNQAIGAAFAEVRRDLSDPADRVIIAHADIPLARDLRVVDGPGLAIAPDRHGDGSNVMSIPARVDFEFGYGPGSFERHRREASRHQLPVSVIDDPTLALDVDRPDDLALLAATQSATPHNHD